MSEPSHSPIDNLITEHIDIWNSAIKRKSSSGRGSNKKIELYGIKKLRELILELAVRGKLVAQDPNDESASVLLERIAAEKAELVKQGKIKKLKKLPEISDDEKPFELPEGWKWCYLSDVSSYIQRGKGPKYAESGTVRVISQKCIQNTGFDVSVAKYVSEGSLESYQLERFLKNNDILWNSTGTGTVGRANVIRDVEDNSLVADSHVTVIRLLNIDSQFMWSFISAPFVQARIEPSHENSLVSGSTKQVELNTSSVQSLLTPIAPIKEQHRIVAKVDELMALCDQLEAQTESSLDAHQTLVTVLLDTLVNSQNAEELTENWRRISGHFDNLFTTEHSIDQLKQTILQLAVMGKLVPQDSNDEPAAKLLERIAAEKDELIKQKKIKKQKPLPPISEDEKPFELPKGWEWRRIADVSLFTEYGTSEKAFDGNNGVPVLKMGDIQEGKVLHGGQKVVPITIADLPNLYLRYGDVLYNRTNSAELVGKTGMFEGENDVYTFASYLIRIRCHAESLTPRFLTLAMNSPLFRKTQIDPHVKQQCGQANVNGTIMKSMIVPLCPLEEQHRIVAKVDELMAICDQLKARLSGAQTTQLNLADALVEQAL